jgi:hypothetical protein
MVDFYPSFNFDEAYPEPRVSMPGEDKGGIEETGEMDDIGERAKAMRQWLWNRPETVIVGQSFPFPPLRVLIEISGKPW